MMNNGLQQQQFFWMQLIKNLVLEFTSILKSLIHLKLTLELINFLLTNWTNADYTYFIKTTYRVAFR